MNDLPAIAVDELSVLDVTLRDGGYRDNWNTPAEGILEIAQLIQNLGIDYVELGYVSDDGKYGDNGTLDCETLRWVRERVGGIIGLAAMLFQDESAQVKVLQRRQGLLDLVRVPLRCERLQDSYPIFDYCSSNGISFSANLTRVSAYTADELLHACDQLSRFRPTYIYLADSRGALLPKEVENIFLQLTSEWPDQAFGFHAHNNLSLALANSIAARDSGARIVDASLTGCGLGAGNLALEHLLAVRHRNDPVGMRRILNLVLEKQSLFQRLRVAPNDMTFAASGALNVSQETVVEAEGATRWIDQLVSTIGRA